MKEPIDPETARELLGHQQDEETTQTQITDDLPRPDRDERDPYGRIERGMLHAHTGSWDHDIQQKWKNDHPEFAREYQFEREAHPDKGDRPTAPEPDDDAIGNR